MIPRSAKRILLVEDNPGDVDLIVEALDDPLHLITVAADGIEAMRLVRTSARPSLILLDLNLPKKDGREVLHEIKSDPELQQIPVVILSSSDAERDLLNAYRLHANCYLTKPTDLEDFLALIGGIAQFWLGFAKLPA
jgi:chemotaxis family two-component system response regulator Rcp1